MKTKIFHKLYTKYPCICLVVISALFYVIFGGSGLLLIHGKVVLLAKIYQYWWAYSCILLVISYLMVKQKDVADLAIEVLILAALVTISILVDMILIPGPNKSNQADSWQMWESKDGNAQIIDCASIVGTSCHVAMNNNWRPATEEELYQYKEEFPRNLPDFVYAGGSLLFGDDPRTGAKIPYVLGYAPVGYSFFPSLIELDQIYGNKLQLIIKRSVPVKGRLEEYAGGRYSIGCMEIPKKSDLR